MPLNKETKPNQTLSTEYSQRTQSPTDRSNTLVIPYIIIKSRWQHRFLRVSLPVHPYPLSPSVVLPNYILYSHRADINKSLLVGQHWHVHEGESI